MIIRPIDILKCKSGEGKVCMSLTINGVLNGILTNNILNNHGMFAVFANYDQHCPRTYLDYNENVKCCYPY